jgi:hypothetical protein
MAEHENNEWMGIEMLSRKKMERRRKLAKLPFEEKILILKKLQDIASGLYKASGRRPPSIWRIS